MNQSVTTVCPKCGASVQEGANFCLHCMTSFDNKQTIEKPSEKKPAIRRLLAIIIPIVAVAAIVISVVIYNVIHKPVCTFQQFSQTAVLASERMELTDLWDAGGFRETSYSKKDKAMQYVTQVNIDNAYLSMFFQNDGEYISAVFCDLQSEDLANAKKILMCITQSVCNYYFTDIEDVFNNEKVYPRDEYDKPFEEYFTDFLKRTDEYNKDIENGAKFSTDTVSMTNHSEIIVLYTTCRDYGDKVLYDLSVYIEKE